MSPRPSAISELIEFNIDNRTKVVAVMDTLARDRNGWLNFQPSVDENATDGIDGDGPAITRVFSARGPSIPLGRWVPGASRRGGDHEPVSLGLQHAGGRRAVMRLRDIGHPVPSSWRVLADHPRRGLVMAVPDGEDHDLTLSWLLTAAERLTMIELPPSWHAGVYRSH